MKKLLYIGLVLICAEMVVAQSISISKIRKYLEIQDPNVIIKDMKQLNFTFKGKDTILGITFYKKSSYGVEFFASGNNSELYAIIYQPANNDFYASLKEIVLTSDFSYTYSYKKIKYYENGIMRIGINDSGRRLSFFMNLKNIEP